MFHMDAAHVSHGTPRMFLQSLESAYKAIRTPVALKDVDQETPTMDFIYI